MAGAKRLICLYGGITREQRACRASTIPHRMIIIWYKLSSVNNLGVLFVVQAATNHATWPLFTQLISCSGNKLFPRSRLLLSAELWKRSRLTWPTPLSLGASWCWVCDMIQIWGWQIKSRLLTGASSRGMPCFHWNYRLLPFQMRNRPTAGSALSFQIGQRASASHQT